MSSNNDPAHWNVDELPVTRRRCSWLEHGQFGPPRNTAAPAPAHVGHGPESPETHMPFTSDLTLEAPVSSSAITIAGPVTRPGVRSVVRLLDEKGEFRGWRVGLVRRVDGEPVGAHVRVARRDGGSGLLTPLAVAREFGWLKDIRRFLIANRYAVRYAADFRSLLLLQPYVKVTEDGATVLKEQPGVVEPADRSLSLVALPVPAEFRWHLMRWEKWNAGMRGIGSADDVRATVVHNEQRGLPVVVGGDGSIWFGDMLFSPSHSTPPVEWEHVALPQHWPGNPLRCALELLPHRGVFREEFYDVPGAEPSRSREVEWMAAVSAVEAALTMQECRVEYDGSGTVRVWHRGGGLMVRTPVPGTEIPALPGICARDMFRQATVEAAQLLAEGGHPGAQAGDVEVLAGDGFLVTPLYDGWVTVRLVGHGRVVASPDWELIAGWAATLERAGWYVSQEAGELVAAWPGR